MRARALGVLASGALVAAALPVIGASTAEALQAPVSFTATALSTYQTDGIAWAVASAQGKVFVGGRFSNVRPPGVVAGAGDPGEVARSNFVVLDAATGAPTSCQPATLLAGDPATASIRSLAVSPDGKTLYVGGYFSTFGGSNRGSMAALDIATCTVVSGFNPAPTGKVLSIAATESTVYYGGEFVSVNTGGTITSRLHAAATAAVGQPDVGTLRPWAPATESTATVGTNPPTYVNSPSVQALNVKPGGGEVVLGGDFERVNGVASHGIASVSDTGTGANVWVNNTIVPVTSAVKSIAVDATGFYTGNEGTGSLQFDGRLAFDWGTHAMRWRDICYGATQSVVVWQNALYSGSHAHNCSLMGEYPDGARHHLLAETLTVDPNPPVAFGNNDPRPAKLAWFPDTNDGPADKCGVTPQLWECIGPRALAVAETAGQDYMYVVGEFSSVNGVPQQGITRFGQTSDAAPSTPVVVATSDVPGQVRVAWRPSLDNDNTDLTYTLQRSADGNTPWTTLQTVTQTSWFWDRPQLVFTDTGRTIGATYWYRVSVTDGVTTKTSGVRTATVTNRGTDLGGGSYGPSPYQAAVLADDPELYLRYDEVGDVFLSDATENRSNVVLKGGASFGPGLVTSDSSRAVTLTGGYGQSLYTQKLEQPMASFALETWFRTTSTRGGKLIGFGNKQDYSSNAFDKQVWITNDGRLAFGVVSGDTKQVLVSNAPGSGGTAYNDGLRHQVVAVQDATAGMRLYVDGALVKSNNVKTNQNNYAGYWHIGGDNLTSWSPAPTYACPTTDPTCTKTAKTSFPFTGTLDETAVYHHALTASQVLEHYHLADTAGTEVAALTPQKPTVSLGGPADGDTVSGVVPIQVVGATTSGTTSHPDTLELLVNGTVADTYTCPTGADVYDCSTSFTWNTAGLGGSYSLTARITSTDALTATSAPAITVHVPLPPTKPTATITDPTASQLVGPGTVTVHATASTVEGSVSFPAAIQLFVDGGTSPVATAPCAGDSYDCAADIPWSTTGLYGAHTLKVRATATDGCQAVPSSCTGNLSSGVAVTVAGTTRTVVTPLTTVRSRSGVIVKGRVTTATGAAVAGIPVKVTATPAIGTPGSRTSTTDANGYFAVPFSVFTNTVFVAATQPTGWWLGSSTAVRQYVTGVPLCTLSATTVRAGVRDVMTCRLSGLPTATPVALQYLVAGKWRTLVKTTSRTGAAYIAFTIRAKGYWYLRTVIASNKVYYTSVSATARVRII